eukprot:1158790-Pelagomonas_calceolata.AAC.18
MMKRHSSHVREPPTQYLKGIKQARSMFCAVCGLNAGESFGYQGCLDERKDTSMSMDSQKSPKSGTSCGNQFISVRFSLRALIHLCGVWWGCREQPHVAPNTSTHTLDCEPSYTCMVFGGGAGSSLRSGNPSRRWRKKSATKRGIPEQERARGRRRRTGSSGTGQRRRRKTEGQGAAYGGRDSWPGFVRTAYVGAALLCFSSGTSKRGTAMVRADSPAWLPHFADQSKAAQLMCSWDRPEKEDEDGRRDRKDRERRREREREREEDRKAEIKAEEEEEAERERAARKKEERAARESRCAFRLTEEFVLANLDEEEAQIGGTVQKREERAACKSTYMSLELSKQNPTGTAPALALLVAASTLLGELELEEDRAAAKEAKERERRAKKEEDRTKSRGEERDGKRGREEGGRDRDERKERKREKESGKEKERHSHKRSRRSRSP